MLKRARDVLVVFMAFLMVFQTFTPALAVLAEEKDFPAPGVPRNRPLEFLSRGTFFGQAEPPQARAVKALSYGGFVQSLGFYGAG